MNTDRIAYFLAVVREGSFSAAAKNMYVSQTAISQQIASLEKEMGCALFHRLSTGAVLTDQGEQFLPYAERLMGIQLELQDAFADAHRVSAIHIGYNGPLEKELIVDAYLSLHPHLPNLVIHPLYLSLTAMSDALYRGQCDMVLTLPGEIDQRNTYQEVLYDVPMIAAVSEASPLAEKSVVSLSDLWLRPTATADFLDLKLNSMNLTLSRRVGRIRILSLLRPDLQWARPPLCCPWQRIWQSMSISR